MGLVLLPSDLLEFNLFPYLDFWSLLSVRQTCKRNELLSRTALCFRVENFKSLLSLGNVFSASSSSPKEKDIALRFFGKVAHLADSKEGENYVEQRGAIILTKDYVYHLKDLIGRGWSRTMYIAEAHKNSGWFACYAHYRMAVCLYELKRFSLAIDQLASMANKHLGEGLANAVRQLHGLCYLELGDMESNEEYLRKSLHILSPIGNALSFYNMACCACLLGQQENAKDYLDRAVQLEKGLPPLAHALNDEQLKPLRMHILTLTWPTDEQRKEDEDDIDKTQPLVDPRQNSEEFFDRLSKHYPPPRVM